MKSPTKLLTNYYTTLQIRVPGGAIYHDYPLAFNIDFEYLSH